MTHFMEISQGLPPEPLQICFVLYNSCRTSNEAMQSFAFIL